MSPDYSKILSVNYAGEEWTLDGDDYAGLTWLSDSPKPSKATLDKLWDSTLAHVAAQEQAKQARRAEILERLGLSEDEAKIILG